MRKRRTGWLRHAALIVAALVVAAIAEESPDVAKLAEQLAASDVHARREAAHQLAQIGPRAKAALPALIKALDDADKQVWLNSINALASLGPDAAEAIPRLIEALGSRQSGGRSREQQQLILRAAYALSRVGPQAVPKLIEALRSADVSRRAGAARAIGGMGAAAQDAVEALVANLGHADANVRAEVVDAVSEIGVVAKPKLIAALDGKEPLERASAALALAGMDKAVAGDATLALLERLPREPDVTARATLLSAAARLGAHPAQLTPALIEALKSPDEPMQRAAFDGLVTSRALHPQAVLLLTALLQSGDATLATRAARVLGGIGAAAKAAAPELVVAFAKEQQPAFREALVQLGNAGMAAVLAHTESLPLDALTGEHWSVTCLRSFGPLAVPALTRALSAPSVATRIVAALALAEFRRDAADAEKALEAALADVDPRVRGQALVALGTVTAKPKLLLPRVKAALEDPAPPVRAGALRLFPLLQGEATPLMAAAVTALRDPDSDVQRAAVEAIGPGAEDAVPTLIDRLSDEPLRTMVLDALLRLGPAAAPAAPRLAELFSGAPEEQRLKVLKAFAKIGPGAQAATSVITGALADARVEVRSAALLALAAVEPDPAKKIPALAAALDDSETRVRNTAMSSLGAVGEKAAETAPQLVKRVATDVDRAVALETLRAIQVTDLPSLIAMLKISDGNVRVFACDRLAALGAPAGDALPALQTLLKAGAGKQVEIATQRAIDKINAAVVTPAP